jgi:hypothetical protein
VNAGSVSQPRVEDDEESFAFSWSTVQSGKRFSIVAREPARRARLVLELGPQQLDHEILGGVLEAPVYVVLETLPMVARLRYVHRLAGFRAQRGFDPLAHRVPVRIRDAEQHADDAPRQLCAQVGDEVDTTRCCKASPSSAIVRGQRPR